MKIKGGQAPCPIASSKLPATQQLFERLEDMSSCPARGASLVRGDDANAEQNTPDFESPAVHDACGHGSKTRRLVTVEEYPWKFVSPQLLDGKGRAAGRSCTLSKTAGIGGGRHRSILLFNNIII
jgi:hypothetical protein